MLWDQLARAWCQRFQPTVMQRCAACHGAYPLPWKAPEVEGCRRKQRPPLPEAGCDGRIPERTTLPEKSNMLATGSRPAPTQVRKAAGFPCSVKGDHGIDRFTGTTETI